MAYYQAPEGFLYDEGSGLYYSQVEALDPSGRKSRVVTWFDAETGLYSQEIYPFGGKISISPSKEPKDRRRFGRRSFSRKEIMIFSGAGIALLCVLILGFWKPGWFRQEKDKGGYEAGGDISSPYDTGAVTPEQGVITKEPDIIIEEPVAEEPAGLGEGEAQEEALEEEYYNEEESRETASYLLSYQEFLNFQLGETKTDSYGVEIQDYDFSCNFDEEGNAVNVSIYYLPFDLEKDDYDTGKSHSFDYDAVTMDKWMEGENTVCIRFEAGGYTIVFKLDYDNEILYSTVESMDQAADPDDPLSLMNVVISDFGTREDLENARDWLHENGIMGF
ncbi:MAG: hypothetical protein K5770_09845 [Lachnospiraceae bacterium]|nr:hypothetical protein [Lachnospiraceae bacterium]